MHYAKKIYNWALFKASLPYAPLWLGLIFLSELFLFLPLDALLMLFCLQNPQRKWIYASIATLSSLFVACIGYGIGFLLWDTLGPFIIKHLLSADGFNAFVQHYNNHENLAIFIGSLLPIPFKLVTLSAGFCKLSLGNYLFFIGLARAVRFFFLAEIISRCKGPIKKFIDRRFNQLLFALGIKIALSFSFFWVLSHH